MKRLTCRVSDDLKWVMKWRWVAILILVLDVGFVGPLDCSSYLLVLITLLSVLFVVFLVVFISVSIKPSCILS